MARFLLSALLFLLIVCLVACGGGNSNGSGVPTTISFSPSTGASVNFGDVTAVVATLYDGQGNAITNPTFTWTIDNTNLATATANGNQCGQGAVTTATCICGGIWDSQAIVCSPPTQQSLGLGGVATLTATASGISSSIKVFVHPKVTQISITPNMINCLTSMNRQQLTATAFFNGTDITANVGPISWVPADSTVATIDVNGLASALNPGRTTYYAAVAGTASTPGTWITCPVKSITLALSGSSGNSFSLAQNATQQITPTVIDSNGNTISITNSALTFSSTFGSAMSVSATGLATGSNPGGTSAIVASCSPNSCNSGLYPIYSNVITGSVQGTTSSYAVAASTSSTSLVEIATANNTAGTAVTLPTTPNSMMFGQNGNIAYLGSNTVLMSFTPSTNTAATIANVPGAVIGVANNGTKLAVYDDPSKTVSVVTSAGTVQDSFAVGPAVACDAPANYRNPGCPRASFSADGIEAWIVVGSTMYISTPTLPLQTIHLTAPANDIAFSVQGSFAFLAGSQNSAVIPRAVCDDSIASNAIVTTNATPARILSSFDGSKMFAIAPPTMNVITTTTDGAGCPPALTTSLATFDMGQGTFVPLQTFMTSNGSNIYMLTDGGKLLNYSTSSNTSSVISLSGGATPLSGGVTLDGASVYVGGSDNNVHLVNSSGADTKSISVGFKPDLVAVMPQ